MRYQSIVLHATSKMSDFVTLFVVCRYLLYAISINNHESVISLGKFISITLTGE